MRDSILKDVNLVRASIYALKVSRTTNMQGIVVRGVDVSSTDFVGIDFWEADFRSGEGRITRFGHLSFVSCDFKGARLDGAKFHHVRFEECKNLTKQQLLRAASLVKVEGLEEEMMLELRREKAELFVTETEE